MKNYTDSFNSIFLSAVVVIVAGIFVFWMASYPTKPTPTPTPQVQKFRFGEQCPDGLRVEYVSTIRLPKSVVCQKAIGE